jgi:hypothetical protein
MADFYGLDSYLDENEDAEARQDVMARSYAGHDDEGRMSHWESERAYLADRDQIRADAAYDASLICECGNHKAFPDDILCAGCERELDGQGFVWRRAHESVPYVRPAYQDVPF